jgi:HEAT repeat protein
VKRARWLACALLAGLAVFGIFQRLHRREPVYAGRPVSAWAHDLSHPDPQVRSNASVVLLGGGSETLPSLVRLLQRRDPLLKRPFVQHAPVLPLWLRQLYLRRFKPLDAANDRLAAVQALMLFGTNAPIAPLARALRDSERSVAAQAATALGQMGRPAVPVLAAALEDPDAYVRSMTCYALSLPGPAAAEAVPALIRRFADPQPNIPPQVAYALGRIGPSAVPALTDALKHPDPRIRMGAAQGLGAIAIRAPDTQVGPSLATAAGDTDVGVRFAAVDAIGQLRPLSPEAVTALTEALRDVDSAIRRKALEGLQRAGRRAAPAVPALIRALDDESDPVRAGAARVLANVGPAASNAIPSLKVRLSDPDPVVRSNVVRALGRIEPETLPTPPPAR